MQTRESSGTVEQETENKGSLGTIVLDAGHGGSDPGMVGVSGITEKELNLIYAQKLEKLLTEAGYQVVQTRTTEEGLYDPGETHQKAQDMQRRCAVIEKTKPLLTVSIHQNSFPDSAQHGAQVFYHPSSQEGKQLASLIQEQTVYLTSEENTRKIKANSDYYLLRDNPIPTVIAEVCFLSNPSEAEMITDQAMQEKAAFAIAMGIMQYLYGSASLII